MLTTTTAGTAVTGLIAETQLDVNLAEAFREQFIKSRRAARRDSLLERGVNRGELRPDLELMIDAIYGSVWYRLLLKHAPLDDAFAEELVNFLIAGILL